MRKRIIQFAAMYGFVLMLAAANAAWRFDLALDPVTRAIMFAPQRESEGHKPYIELIGNVFEQDSSVQSVAKRIEGAGFVRMPEPREGMFRYLNVAENEIAYARYTEFRFSCERVWILKVAADSMSRATSVLAERINDGCM